MPKVEDSKIGAVVSWLFLLGLFVLCWYWGFQFGGTALTDPDSCWLLAVGRWILAHCALPQSDPFSWTLAANSSTYLPYQWLATLFFYGLYCALGAKSLLFFVSLIVLLVFLLLPLCLARKLNTSAWAQCMISVLAVSAGSFHFPLRPELFSYLGLALVLSFILTTVFGSPLDPDAAAVQAPGQAQTPACATSVSPSKALAVLPFQQGLGLFVLWANLHSGFVLGLFVLVTTLVCIGLSLLSQRAHAGGRDIIGRIVPFLTGAFIGSLITPFQFRLYVYLPELFFSPMNRFNQELLPLRPHELLSFDYLPFFILQIILIVSFVPLASTFFRPKPGLASADSSASNMALATVFGFALLTSVSFVAGDLCRRMIPFAVLISCSYFIALCRIGVLPAFFSSLKGLPFLSVVLLQLAQIDKAFNNLLAGSRPFAAVVTAALIFIGLGTQASASQFPVTIPQTTFAFEAPRKAVDFVREHRPQGNVLNDPQFGDLLIWSMDEKAKVFIDTRFDLYGPKFCHDYFVMANCLDGYEILLETYKIDWVFFPHNAPIATKLKKSSQWRTVYEDTAAVIIIKQRADNP